MKILRDPAVLDQGGASGTGDWAATLAPELKPVVQAKGWKGPADVVSSYVNLEKMLGGDKILAPKETWTDKEWGDFYTRIGRPDAAEKYTIPEDVKLNEGLKLDDAKLKNAKETFHKLGLSSKQASELMRFYLGTLNASDSDIRGRRDQEIAAGTSALKQEFGDRYESQIDMAKAVVQKFGDESLVTYLNESGLGNHPALIRAFAKIGSGMLEDKTGGKGSGLVVRDATKAKQEIDTLKYDGEFQKALNDRGNAGHQAAVQRWLDLHKIAHPGEIKEQ